MTISTTGMEWDRGYITDFICKLSKQYILGTTATDQSYQCQRPFFIQRDSDLEKQNFVPIIRLIAFETSCFSLQSSPNNRHFASKAQPSLRVYKGVFGSCPSLRVIVFALIVGEYILRIMRTANGKHKQKRWLSQTKECVERKRRER